PGICGCGTADTDSDSDGTADCNDGCPNDPNKVEPGNCGCGQTEESCLDCAGIPNGPALPGSTCDDGDPNTIGDVWSNDCLCAGSIIICDSDAGPDQSTCDDLVQLDASGVGTWSVPGTVTLSDLSDPNTTATCSVPGTYDLIWTVSVPGCTATDTVSITFLGTPSAGWSVPVGLCDNSAPIDLNSAVTGDPGGTWSGNGVSDGMFDPTGLSGDIQVTYLVQQDGCSASASGSINVGNAPSADAGPDDSVCGNTYTLHGSKDFGTGTWSGPFAIDLVPVGSTTALVTNAAPGTYDFTWTVTSGPCSSSDVVRITFLDPGSHLVVDAGPDQVLEVVPSTYLEATASTGATIEWSLLNGSGSVHSPNEAHTEVSGLSSGLNTFVITVSLGGCIGDRDTVNVHLKDLFIPEGFSPNQDGDNDRFEITGISAYPGSTLIIFNRWGKKVYENNAYNNDWDGRSRNGLELADDTYFYVLNLSDDHSYNGFVVIKR
ncbi:MAG: gliding motility-associated C-terminal domain-containing protein, partial [Flavobacteriales bacterium]|nr:gliding motility-associated C-terminal domain-containing protein [Flavobacteriales bacterium]